MKLKSSIYNFKLLLFVFIFILCLKLFISMLSLIPYLNGYCLPALAQSSSNISPTNQEASNSTNTNNGSLYVAPQVLEILEATIRNNKDEQVKIEKEKNDLLAVKEDINARIEELKRLESILTSPAKKAQKQNMARFEHLVSVYSAMNPQKAAILLDKLDDNTVAQIFAIMKSRKVAKILALMKPDKAARISAILSQKKISLANGQ